tara:strand:- start:84 stop:518 length:435 start_codon:yes stop_codon:yes gene_type:complete
MKAAIPALALLLTISACSPGTDATLPGEADDTQPYAGIGEGETINMVGTEPFWSAELAGVTLTWTTPDQPGGIVGTVERFAGRGGYSLSGKLAGRSFDATITPTDCSDGMSDRSFPFAATIRLGDEILDGCAWTSSQPFTEAEY